MAVILVLSYALLVQWGRVKRVGCEGLDWLVELKDGDGEWIGGLTE